MNSELTKLRAQVSRLLVILLACQIPIVAIVAQQTQHDMMWPTIMAALDTAMAVLFWLRAPADLGTRLVVAVASVVMVSIILAVCEGTVWQEDIHMDYFATLAICAAYCDPLVILAAAGAVAVHHLGLNFIAPMFLFRGGSQLMRVFLHAGILILEAGALTWLCHRVSVLIASRALLTSTLADAEKSRALEAEVARQRLTAEESRAASEAEKAEARRRQEDVLLSLSSELERTAPALDAITETIAAMAAGTSDAAKVVASARTAAELSGTTVTEAVETMRAIQDSSRTIAQFIGVIDEIAMRTDLLALNAGVEAARAGDAGRGFAVVATEVRNLAQRSTAAATDIKAMMNASTSQIDEGVVSIGKTGVVLAGIIRQIAELDGLLKQISASSREQASSLASVNAAVRTMDRVVHENGAIADAPASEPVPGKGTARVMKRAA